MTSGVHLLVPIKPLHLAKSRLLGAAEAHHDLVTALALDTVAAARRTPGVTGVIVVTSDPALTDRFTDQSVDVVPDTPRAGLNAALRHGEIHLHRRDRVARVGALQADLPALRPAELAAALDAAGKARAFCPDRQGTGTTLLLAAPGQRLDPRFGPNSASAHRSSGAMPLEGPWDSVRCDVDTARDLALAAGLGLGKHCRDQHIGPLPHSIPRSGGDVEWSTREEVD